MQIKRSMARNGLKLTTLALVMSSVVPMTASNMAHAQVSELEEVVVTGIRSSLKRSLDVKRDATKVVDAISAEDVGKFPDANIAESLQRITGVAIDRSGGEGQFITVRGLGPEFNNVLLNGRQLATDNDGREFSFDTFSSSIISRAEVFKTATPDVQSGGIGATVNIVTTRPLDGAASNTLNFSAGAIFDDLRSDTSPDLSVNGNWVNDAGTFGAALGVSYTDRATQRDRVFTNGFNLRSGDAAIIAPEGAVGLTAANFGSLPDGARAQQQVVVSRDLQDRERTSVNLALQGRPNDRFEVTFDALFSEFDIQSFETQFSGFFSPPFIDPVIDANNTVTEFGRPSVDFLNRNPALRDITGESQNDNVITADNREAEVTLFGLNLKYDFSDSFTATLDLSTSEADRVSENPFVVLGALAPESPRIFSSVGDIAGITNVVQPQNTSIQRLHFVNVRREVVDDEIDEAKVNFDWNIERGALNKISFGAAISDRTKSFTLFDNFSSSQGGGIFCAFCGYTVDFDDGILSPVNFDDFLSGVSGRDSIPLNFLTSTFEQAFAQLNSEAAIRDPLRNAGSRADISDDELIARRDAAGDSVFGFFEPGFNSGGSFAVDEEVTSFFLNTEWGGELGSGIPWSANVGFRVARTEIVSSGVTEPVVDIRESAGDTQLNFSFGESQLLSVSNSYTNFLPSANIRFDIADDKILRFAASQTLTRPTLTALGVANTFGGRSNAPVSGGGNPELEAFESINIDASFEWYVDDLSFVGITAFYKDFDEFIESSTLPVPQQIIIPAGNIGNTTGADQAITVNFQDTRDRNGETGNITGAELALQKAWENGWGASLNYTYVTSSIDRADDFGAPIDCDYNGLSENVVNVSGFFENDKWSARLSYNYRDDFLVQCFGPQSEPQNRESFGQVDFSASYNINDSLQVFFQGVNILDEERRDFSIFDNRFLEFEDTGPRYTLGIRGNFGY